MGVDKLSRYFPLSIFIYRTAPATSQKGSKEFTKLVRYATAVTSVSSIQKDR